MLIDSKKKQNLIEEFAYTRQEDESYKGLEIVHMVYLQWTI